MTRCPNCNTACESSSRFCDQCGMELAQRRLKYARGTSKTRRTSKREPPLVAVFSLICPGLGHLYCEQYGKAWMFLLLSLFAAVVLSFYRGIVRLSGSGGEEQAFICFSFLVLIGIWGWSLVDSVVIAGRIKEREIKTVSRDPVLKVLICLAFILVALLLGGPAIWSLVSSLGQRALG